MEDDKQITLKDMIRDNRNMIRDFVDAVFGSVDDWISSSLCPWYRETMSAILEKWRGLHWLVKMMVIIIPLVLMVMGMARVVQFARR